MTGPPALPQPSQSSYFGGAADARASRKAIARAPFLVRYFAGTVTASRLRPLRRRRLNRLRPDLVFIRARKPCTRSRFRFRGLYVGFTGSSPRSYCQPKTSHNRIGLRIYSLPDSGSRRFLPHNPPKASSSERNPITIANTTTAAPARLLAAPFARPPSRRRSFAT